jgi:hypothetical protein
MKKEDNLKKNIKIKTMVVAMVVQKQGWFIYKLHLILRYATLNGNMCLVLVLTMSAVLSQLEIYYFSIIIILNANEIHQHSDEL